MVGLTAPAVGLIGSAPIVGPLESPEAVDELVSLGAWWSAAVLSGWLALSIVVLGLVIDRPTSRCSRLAKITIPGSHHVIRAVFAVAVLGTPPACTPRSSEVATPRLEVLGTVVSSTTTPAARSTTRPAASTDSSGARSATSSAGHPDDPDPTATPEVAEPDPEAADSVGPATALTHVVVSGEHFWSIAERRLLDVLGGPASVAQITDYWVRLVRFNQASLRSGDPDLIHPGEVIVLPPPDLDGG